MLQTPYDNIVHVVEHYLGPAAPRFVDRHIQSHLQKPPQDVTAADMPHLTEWMRLSFALLTDDRSIIEECTQRLNKLYE